MAYNNDTIQSDSPCIKCGSWYTKNGKCNRCGIPKYPSIALSIKQPWAWAICNAGKDIENRSWPTKFRGRFLIHTGKKVDEEGIYFLLSKDITLPNKFDLGGIVGLAEIVNCVSSHNSKWFLGPYGFVLSNQKPLTFMPLKGQLSFFKAQYEEVKHD